MPNMIDGLRQFTRNPRPSDIFRFWLMVDRKSENECWLWTGYIGKEGYGQFKLFGKAWLAHRVSYKINVGDPGWSLVLHDDDHCKSKACINPNHLRLGTDSENRIEAFATGKQSNKGSDHPLSLLIEREVGLVRDRLAKGDKQSQIAKDLGVKIHVISDIARGRSWNHT